MSPTRPRMYAANTDARVPRVRSAARILGVAVRVAPNPTTTYVEAMRQDAAAQAAAEMLHGPSGSGSGSSGGRSGRGSPGAEGVYGQLTPQSGSESGGGAIGPMPGGFSTWARRGSSGSARSVSPNGSDLGSVSGVSASGESGSGGSKLYMTRGMFGPGAAAAAGARIERLDRVRQGSPYYFGDQEGDHPQIYASPPDMQRGASLELGGRPRSSSVTDQGAPPLDTANTGEGMLGRSGSLPSHPPSRLGPGLAPSRSRSPSKPRVEEYTPAQPSRIASTPSPSGSYSSLASVTPLYPGHSPAPSYGRGLPSPSPASLRHPTTRLISPDLPPRDALYLFCNFASYMRSPQEGAEGIRDNTDFGDTIRLLDFARVSGVPCFDPMDAYESMNRAAMERR